MNFRSPLARVTGHGAAKDGAGHWWVERVTGAALLPLGAWFLLSLSWLHASGRLADHQRLTEWLSAPSAAIPMLLFSAAFLRTKSTVIFEAWFEIVPALALIGTVGFTLAIRPATAALLRANASDPDRRARPALRFGDVYDPPIEPGTADLVTIHQVLHFLSDPGLAVSEGARLLKPGGRLVIVDFAPHELEFLREEHALRLG